MLTVTFLKLDQRFVTASSGGLHFNSGYFGPGGDHKINFIIRYSIRTESDNFLNQDIKAIDFDNISETEEEKFQDIYYFKKTLRIIHEKLGNYDKDKFSNFLLNKIKLNYYVRNKKNQKLFTYY